MNTSEPELPQHLYTETTEPGGTATRATVATDKLIAWAEDERGDAVDRWCQQIHDKEIKAIDAWEDDRILQLEDEWMSLEHDEDAEYDEDEDEDEDERRYHLACEAVIKEASIKRGGARKRMAENRAAIEALVEQSRAYIETHKPPPHEGHTLEYLVALAVFAAVVYLLLT